MIAIVFTSTKTAVKENLYKHWKEHKQFRHNKDLIS